MQGQAKMASKKEQKRAVALDNEVAEEYVESDPEDLWEDLDSLKE